MQRYFTNKKNSNEFILNNNDLHHIKTVMRMKDHDRIEVVYDKQVFICCLENVKSDIKIIIDKKVEDKYFNNIEIVLAIPLLKEQKMDLVLQKATELGVSKIVPINTKRSVIKIDKVRELKKIERWNKICKEASEQSKRNVIPQITNIKNIEELAEDGLKIVCSTTENKKFINNVLKNIREYDKIIIVVGPEGGLAKEEEVLLNKMGFVSTSLGSLIMRVETVPIYLLSVLNYELME